MIRGTLCTKLYVIIFQLRWNGYKDRPFISSCPQFEGVIPASSCNGSAIGGALEAGYAALVAVEHGDPVRLEGVPHVDGVVVVPAEEHPPRVAEVDRVAAEQDGLLGVLGHLPVRPEVEEPAAGVVEEATESLAWGEVM